MIRTFIICQEEPFFIPKQVKLLSEEAGKHYELVGAAVLAPKRKGGSRTHRFFERAKSQSLGELLLTTFAYGYCRIKGKLLRLLGRRDPYSVADRFREHQVPLFQTKDIDEHGFIEQVKGKKPDVILSISSPQIFKRELLEAPRLYCLNLHGSLLPRNRGVFGTWWTLYNDDPEAGGSIHSMDERLDKGDLLWQRAYPIEAEDTEFSLAYKNKQLMAEGTVELLRKIEEGKEEKLEESYSSSYHHAPTREEGKAFHRKGKKVIGIKDLRLTLHPSFVPTGSPRRKQSG